MRLRLAPEVTGPDSPRRVPAGWWRRPVRAPRGSTQAPQRPQARGAFLALLAFTFVLVLAPHEIFPVLAPLHLAFVAALAAALAHANARSAVHGRLLARGRESSLAIALGCWAAATVPFSLWPSESLELLTSSYLKSLFIFLLLSAAIDSTERLRQVARALCLCSLPLSATALLHFASGDFIGGGGQVVDRIVGYNSSLAADPNDLALLLNLILPLTGALFFTQRGAWQKGLLGFAMVASAAAVVVTFSRAGFLTLFVVVAGLCWRLWRGPPERRAWLWAVLALAVFSVALLPHGYLAHLLTIGDVSSDPTGSAQGRSHGMWLALGLIAERPLLGAGLGMDSMALAAVRSGPWTHVHNVFLQLAVDLGLPGLGLFIALFWSCAAGLRTALRRLAGSGRSELLELTAAVQLCLIAFAVAGFFLPAAYRFSFFYFAGLAVAARGLALGDA